MGYNNDHAHISPIVVDIETWPLENAADYLEPVQAAANLKDPEKIKADIEARTVARAEKLALDWNVGRIAAIGWWTEDGGIEVRFGMTEATERAGLEAFWHECKARSILGFNIKGFDLKYLIQRSRYLGVEYPMLDLGKYARKGVTDLFLELTFNDGTYDQGAMRRTLHAFCKRFGLAVDDTIQGKDVPALALAGKWDEVEAHVRSDVALTVNLARKLGLVATEDDEDEEREPRDGHDVFERGMSAKYPVL